MPGKLFNLSASTTTSKILPIPSSYWQAFKDLNWHAAMLDEFNALLQNNTWSLIPCPAGANVVSGKWIFRHKPNPDGSLSRYKARWYSMDSLSKLVWTMARLSVPLSNQ
jgi:hypothetical protein